MPKTVCWNSSNLLRQQNLRLQFASTRRCCRQCLFGLLASVVSTLALAGDTAGVSGSLWFLWGLGRDPIGVMQGLGGNADEERRRKLYGMAIKRCEAETKLLPDAFDITSVIDEGASLRSDLIYELLVRRGVRAIYVQPMLGVTGTNGIKFLRYGLPNGEGSGDWTYKPAVPLPLPFIKLELASRESGRCAANPEFSRPNDGGDDRFSRPPLLPNTCLAISTTNKPDAQVVLRYLSAKDIGDEEFGRWSLVDILNGKVIASLTTIDIPPRVSSEARHGASTDCRSPYSVLAWRVQPKTLHGGEFSVEMHDVAPDPPISELWKQKRSLTPIIPTVTRSLDPKYGSDKYKLLFGEDLYPIAWSTAVAEAVSSGRGHYVHSILDWNTRKLGRLRDDDMKKGYSSVMVRAADAGYFVFSNDWRGSDSEQLLARYNHEGKLDWAVKIAATGPNCFGGPRAVEVSPTHIALRTPSCDGGIAGTNWEIRKLDIPFYAAQMKPTYESMQAIAEPAASEGRFTGKRKPVSRP